MNKKRLVIIGIITLIVCSAIVGICCVVNMPASNLEKAEVKSYSNQNTKDNSNSVAMNLKNLDNYTSNYGMLEGRNEYNSLKSKIKIGLTDLKMMSNEESQQASNEVVSYTVKHYKMNIDGETYADPEIETKTGIVDTEVTPSVKEYEGFTAPETQTVNLTENGETVVEYYYTRNKYKVILNSTVGISEITGAGEYYYEEEVSISAKVMEGYTFKYWIDNNKNEYKETSTKIKLGASNIIITASANANDNTTYIVKHYKMNIDGETYAEPEIENKTGKTNSTVAPSVKKYEGFTSPRVNFAKIDPNGKTVVEYYYTRNKYKVSLNPGNGILGVIGAGQYYYEQEVPITAKIKNGYTFNRWIDNNRNIYNEINTTIKMGAKNIILTASAVSNENTPYVVKHYKMNLDGKTYAEPEIENKTGETNTSVTPEVKNYEGFTAPETKTVNIDEKGKTVVEYYYTRNKYKLILNAGEGIESAIGSGKYYYEQEVSIKANVLPGYTFEHWVDNNKTEYKETDVKIKMGVNDIEMTASAKVNGETPYTVKHYKMNLDGKTYAEPEIENKLGKTNETITPEVKNYEGFTAPETKTVNIDGKGNTVVEYYYTRNKYKLTLKTTPGIALVTGEGQYYYEEEVLVSAKTLEGYVFDQWEDDNGHTSTDAEVKVKMGARDAVVTAYAKPTEYTITYDANGGTAVVLEKKYRVGDKLSKPSDPIYAGHTFIGWYINLDDEEPFNFDTTMPDKDFTLYAKWQVNKYTVVFNANGGQGEMANQELTYGEAGILNANKFTKNGYTFAGWSETENGSVKFADKAEITDFEDGATKNLYAVWNVVKYKIEYDLDGGTLSSENKTEYTIETESFKLNAPTKEGYTFKGWTLSDGSMLKDSTIIKGTTGNLKLKATYELNKKYKIIFNANNGTNSTIEQEIEYDKETKLIKNTFTKAYTITYNYNYSGKDNENVKVDNKFLGWATDPNGKVEYENETTIKAIDNGENSINLYAIWENPTITLKQISRDNYTFVGWSTSADTSGLIANTDCILVGDITLTAIWSDNSPKIESISFDVKDSSGKPYTENVGMGDNAFYLKFPQGSSFDIGSLKLKTNMPISLNANAVGDPNYIDIRPSTVDETGLSGKVRLELDDMAYNMKVSSTDGINWATTSTSRYVSVERFLSLKLVFLGDKEIAIAKGFGINSDGLQTPHYISTTEDIQGTTYMFFKEENTPDVTVKYVNGTNKLIEFSIPQGSIVPQVQTINVGGADFENWYADETLTTLFDFSKPIYGDITIYGKYTVKKDVNMDWYYKDPKAESYNISTLEELKGFAYLSSLSETNSFRNKTINLMNDIDLKNEKWTPINYFEGTFNGNNHTIYNLNITESTKKMYIGFFERTFGATISNLKFENVNINAPDCTYVGTVVGSDYYPTTFERVSVNKVSITGYANVGGIVGSGQSKILGCSVTQGQVYAKGYIAAGIIARADGNAILENIYSNVLVKADSTSDVSDVGGILGEFSSYGDKFLTMNNVLFTGKIESKSKNTGAIYGNMEGNVNSENANTWLYDKNNIGLTDSEQLARGTAKTTDELKKASTYEGWDNNVWNITNGSYPTLK